MPIDHNILRSQLESELKHLHGQLAQLEANVPSPEEKRESTPFGKRDEGAMETLALEKRLTLEKRTKDQLLEVKRALQKFEEGTYGRCDKCGDAIDPARMEALPQANLCLDCKVKSSLK